MAQTPKTSSKLSPRPMQAVIIVSTLYLLARLIGLIQTSLINRLLRPGDADAYWAAFAVPDFLNYLVAGGALSITFIPIFTQLVQQGREREAWRFFSTIATMIGGALLILIVAAEFVAESLVSVARSGLLQRPAVFELAVDMTRVLLPAQWFLVMGFLLVAVLNAYKRFSVSSWTSAIYNLVAILVALILLWLGAGPIAFAWGILAGALIGNFALPLWAALTAPPAQRPKYLPRLEIRSPIVRLYFMNALPIMLGVSLPVVDQLVVGWFASFLPVGALTYLVTGNRVMIAAQGVVGQAASVAAFPFLSDLAARGAWQEYSKFLRDGLRRLLFITLPLSTLLILLARPIVTLLFGYGEFNNATALSQTSIAFAFYSIGLFAWVAQQLVARGFYAMQDTRTPTLIGSGLTIFFFIPLTWAASRGYIFGGGVLALAMATSIGAAAHFLGVLIALEKRLSSFTYTAPLRLEKLSGVMLRTLCACVCMALFGQGASTLVLQLLPTSTLGALLQILIVGTVAIATFACCAKRFEIPEWNWFSSQLLMRFKWHPSTGS